MVLPEDAILDRLVADHQIHESVQSINLTTGSMHSPRKLVPILNDIESTISDGNIPRIAEHAVSQRRSDS
jgi:hypothetical protein